VCVTGIDGAGKTTVSKRVASELPDAKYVYGKYLPRLLLPLLWLSRLLFLRDTDGFDDYTEHTERKEQATDDHPLLSRLYVSIMLIDYTLQLLFRLIIPLWRGQSVVCDRYVFDTVIVDIADDFDYSMEESLSLIDRLLDWYPVPDEVVLIDVPEEVSMERKDDIPAYEYIHTRRKRYQQFAEHFHVTTVDGTMSLEKVVERAYDRCRQ